MITVCKIWYNVAMAFMLMSLLNTHRYDEAGNRVSIALDNANGVLDCIASFLPRRGLLLTVANDPFDFADNDEKLRVVSESFIKTGLPFARYAALDDRNKSDAEALVKSADLIILSGGKCLCQNKFFDGIGLKRLLKNHRGLTVGISAGAMNLCTTVANFPEEKIDLAEPRWFAGMGFFDGIVIPHFDGETAKYQFDCGEIDIVNDYILPMSFGHEFIGLNNDSYIVVDNCGGVSYRGEACKISDGRITRI